MAPREKGILDKFRNGDQFLWGKFLAAAGHLIAVLVVLAVTAMNPPALNNSSGPAANAQSEESTRIRQLLLEALDHYVRFQHYHREVYGRFSRDLRSLGVPLTLPSGSTEELRHFYEISVSEADSKRFLILANAQPGLSPELQLRGDRVTVDERYRLNANFTIPPLNKKYLIQTADRILDLKLRGRVAEMGIAAEYWRFEQKQELDRSRWVAVGRRGSAVGTLRQASFEREPERSVASIFQQVRRRLNQPVQNKTADKGEAENNRDLDIRSLNFLLNDARFAQYIHYRERGVYTEQWGDLDQVAGFQIEERVRSSTNISQEPIELVPGGFVIRLKATRGALLGEVFAINELGAVKQIRFSDVLVKELKDTASLLGNPTRFQISEVHQLKNVDERSPAGFPGFDDEAVIKDDQEPKSH